MGRRTAESLHTAGEWRQILDGATMSEAVSRTGLCVQTVRRIARGLGIRMRKKRWSDGMDPEELRELCSELPVKEASRRLGVSPASIVKERKRLGVPRVPHKKRGRAASKRAILLYLSKSFTYDSIAELLGKSRQYVQQECAKAERQGDEIDPEWRLRDDKVQG